MPFRLVLPDIPPSNASTSKLQIIDQHTIRYDGTYISIELLEAFVNPQNIPSRWMRVVRKDGDTGFVTMETMPVSFD